MTGNSKQADTQNAAARNDNMINKVFMQQMNFQRSLGNTPTIDQMKDQILCLMAEANEALNELPWKHWKKQQTTNMPKFQEELVDVQLFLLNLVGMSGMNIDDFLIKCQNKQITNGKRQEENY